MAHGDLTPLSLPYNRLDNLMLQGLTQDGVKDCLVAAKLSDQGSEATLRDRLRRCCECGNRTPQRVFADDDALPRLPQPVAQIVLSYAYLCNESGLLPWDEHTAALIGVSNPRLMEV